MMENMKKQGGQTAGAGMEVTEDMMKMVSKMKLRDMLAFGNAPQEVVEQIDGQLRKIPNI